MPEKSNSFQIPQSQCVFGKPAVAKSLDEGLDHKIDLSAFGQNVSVLAPEIDFLRADSLWRLRHIYQPALAAQTLPTEGMALDIGAGFGAFALPFALAYPGWRVVCFEPDRVAFSFLQKNIHDLCLPQITALPFAVGYQKDTPQNPKAVRAALWQLAAGTGEGIDVLRALLPLATHSKSKINLGYLERGQNKAAEFETVQIPTLAAAMLDDLSPRLLKIVAPKVEAEILSDLSHSRIDHVLGESWGHINSALIHSPVARERQTWMPRAGQPKLALRRPFETSGRSSRLDIILALPATKDADYSWVSALLSDNSDDIKVLAVGDISADQDAALNAISRNDPRLRLYAAQNLAKSSAWNFGRLQSTATHLAFVDCQSFPAKGFFSGLLDLARQTGAEVVQGPYVLIDHKNAGRAEIVSNATFPTANRVLGEHFQFADTTYQRLTAFAEITNPPSIWRRVYRRDFLDNRAIWFPENLKSNGEFAFQTMTLHHTPDVPELGGIMFGRQADAIPPHDQAICALESFELLITTAANEGWNDLAPVFQAFKSQVKACSIVLDPQEHLEFLASVATLWAIAHKVFGSKDFTLPPLDLFQSSDPAQPF